MRTASRTNFQRLLSTVRRSSFGLYQMVLRAEFGSSVPLEKGSVKVDFTDLNDLNLRVCILLKALAEGRQVHAHLIKGYAQNGEGEEALRLFCQMQRIGTVKPNEVTFASILNACTRLENMEAGYVKNGLLQKSFQLLQQMECEGMKPSEVTFLSLLSACGISGNLDWGKQVHAYLIKTGIVLNTALGNTLIVMYSKHGSIGDAWHVYKKMDIRDVVSCNAMIAGYTEHGHGEEAFELYQNMETECVKSNHVTFVSILKTCAILGNMDYGYSKNESPNEAIKLFWIMDEDSVKPNEVTCLSIISACSSIGNLEQGMKIHAQIVKIGFQLDAFVANALIDMYGKCGTIKDSCYLFDNLPTRDVISWNAIISGYSQHGYARETLLLVERMQQEGVKPNQITFIGILSACSRAGLVDEGCYYFHSMITDYKIFATSEHCACIVDLLGRVGHLDDAETFVEKMSVHCTAVVWRALLNACRIHGHADLGEHFVEKVLEFEPQNIAAVVMLSNIYAAAGRWEDQAEFVRLMKERV